MSSNIPSYLQPYTSNFYGLGTSSADDIKQGNALYKEFLASTGLTASAVASATTAQQATYLAQYAAFLEKQLGDIYQVESIVSLSPEEMAKRNILFETFSTVLKMLDALQGTVRAISQAMVFYAKWQDQYTSMMTKIPLYAPGATSTLTANLGDMGKTKIGYAGITIADVTNYLLNGALDEIYAGTSGTKTFNVNSALSFNLVYDGTTKQVKLDFLSTGIVMFTSGYITLPALKNNAKTSVGSIMASFTQNFQTASGQIPGATAGATYELIRNTILGGAVTGLLWSDITQIATNNDDLNKSRAGTRGELNGKLQLYIENARSLRQQVKDRMQPVQDILSQAREAIQSQSNLLSSITDSMKGIIASIFR